MEYLKEVLSPTGIKILTAYSAEQSIEIVGTIPKIDIILMDIRLGAMDGYEATKIIKNKYPDMKIIAQTAYASNTDRSKALQAGCDDYISKPINADLLLSKMKQFLLV